MKRVIKTPFPSLPVLSNAEVLGAAVRACRTGANMTIEEAAMTIGVAKQTLSDLEAGKPTVGLGVVLKITEALGISLIAVKKQDMAMMLNTLKAKANESAWNIS
ncbi:MAG: helix-turn-helix domain-containing protein [Collimonas sp.]|uniref:helix-turn-helix domain-containing protein n=1 Tax=Collimonas sp. TaxID=1963772 RepID=UPI00326618E1